MSDTMAELVTGTSRSPEAAERARQNRFRIRRRPRNYTYATQPAQNPPPHGTDPVILEEYFIERRQSVRRKQDGLGLLPVAKTPDERQYRTQLNRLAGLFLAGFGAFIAGGSSKLLTSGSTENAVLGMVLGAVMMGQGLYLVGRRERRRRGRRKVRAKGTA
ncbi:hypothetical protein [Deinococcus sp. UYEF24]